MYKRYRGLLAVMLALTLLICTVPITPAEVKAADMPAGDYLNVVLTNSGSTSSSLVTDTENGNRSAVMLRNTAGNQCGYFKLYGGSSRVNINIGDTTDLSTLDTSAVTHDGVVKFSSNFKLGNSGDYEAQLAGSRGGDVTVEKNAFYDMSGSVTARGGRGSISSFNTFISYGDSIKFTKGIANEHVYTRFLASTAGGNEHVKGEKFTHHFHGGGTITMSNGSSTHTMNTIVNMDIASGYSGNLSGIKVGDLYYVAAGGGQGSVQGFQDENDGGGRAYGAYARNGWYADYNDVPFGDSSTFIVADALRMGQGWERTSGYPNFNTHIGHFVEDAVFYHVSSGISPNMMYQEEIEHNVPYCIYVTSNGFSMAYGGYSGVGKKTNAETFELRKVGDAPNLRKGANTNDSGYVKLKCTSKMITIPNPTRTGYVFKGWECSGNVTAKRNADGGSYEIKVMQSGATITAKWKPISYKIRYYKGESDTAATPPSDTTVKFDQNVTYSQAGQLIGRSYTVNFYRNLPAFVSAPETCTLTDHVVSGNLQCANTWNILGSLATMGSTSTVPPNYASQQDKVIRATAQWQPKTITNFATGTMEGYTLKGWYTQPTGGTKVTSLTINPATSAYTTSLYAQWEGIKYKVIYKAGDGGSGSDVTETWQFSAPHDLYNNVPQLTGAGGTPHFTKNGYYIDYWIFSATGDRNTACDVGNIVTGTGYNGATAKGIVKTYSHGNLIQPRKNGCVVTLTAHWAPIKYKVQYNNDTTIVEGKGYSTSTGTFTTDDFLYGEVYPFANFNPTRSNKFGASTFLGYGYNNGDTTKTIKYYVDGKSLAKYRNMGAKTSITATDFTGLKTTAGTSQYDYFHWLNPGNIQTFNIYAVWDDCPGITPIDLQWGGNTTDANSIITYDKQPNSSTHSAKMSEFFILNNSNNKSTVWDREDPVDTITSNMKDRYYIDGFAALNIGQQKTYDNGTVEPTSYELKYTVVDSNGNKYQVSKKLYVGNLANIMVGGSALQQ